MEGGQGDVAALCRNLSKSRDRVEAARLLLEDLRDQDRGCSDISEELDVCNRLLLAVVKALGGK